MAILNTCCGCCNVRTGSMVTAVVMLIVCGIDLGARFGYTMYEPTATYTGVVLDGIFALLCIFLIVGVAVNNRYMCLAWVVAAIVYLVLDMLLCIVTTVMMLVAAKTAMDDFDSITATLATPIDNDLATSAFNLTIAMTIATVWVVFVVVAGINIYCILVVYSYYQNLRDTEEADDQPSGPPPAYVPPAPGYSVEAANVELKEHAERKDTPATLIVA